MAKSTNTYFESVQNKSVKSIESLIAEINNVSLRDVKGKVMNQKALMKALMKSGSEIWTNEKAAPSSNTFKIRYATMMVSYVFSNLDKFTRVFFSINTGKNEAERIPVGKVVEDIFKYLYELCDAAVGPFDPRYYDIIYMFAVMDIIGNSYVDDKYGRLEKIHDSLRTLNLRLRSEDSDDEKTFGNLLRLTYIFSTNVPSVKKAKFFVEGYEFNQKATTYRMIEKLGEIIEETIAKVGVSRIFYIFMQCNPAITTRWTKGVSVNKNLALGCLALSYMKFLNNGTPIGDLCFWLK